MQKIDFMPQSFAYNEAYTKLETIVNQLESGELDLDEMMTKVKEATDLVIICRAKLKGASETLEELTSKLSA